MKSGFGGHGLKMNSVGILFPGQGAQAVGMGRWLCENHATAKSLFDQASEILGYDLGGIMHSADPKIA